LYPNPSRDFVNLDLDNLSPDEPVKVQIIDSVGRVVEQLTSNGARILLLNLGNFTAGYFICKVIQSDNVFFEKFAVE
jgi:hypothetical protein